MPCLSGGAQRWLTAEPFGDLWGARRIVVVSPLPVTGTVGAAGDHVLVFFLFPVTCKEKLYQVSFSPDQGICGHLLGSEASSPSG